MATAMDVCVVLLEVAQSDDLLGDVLRWVLGRDEVCVMLVYSLRVSGH